MSKEAELRIYRLATVCFVLAAASWVVPRFVSNPEGGFAAGASAVLALLGMLGASFLVSLYVLVVAVKNYNSLSTLARIAGICPSLVLAAVLFGLFGFLTY